MKILSRTEARQQRLKQYFTGVPCPHGHIARRQTSNCSCLECEKTKLRKYWNTPEKKAARALRQYMRQYNARPEVRSAKNKLYYQKHREHHAAINRAYRLTHPEWYKKYNREYYLRNKERQSANAKRRRQLHLEQVRACAREKYHKKRDVIGARKRLRYATDAEYRNKSQARGRQYARNHREQRRQYVLKNREQIRKKARAYVSKHAIRVRELAVNFYRVHREDRKQKAREYHRKKAAAVIAIRQLIGERCDRAIALRVIRELGVQI
jgi:hypothetical protein